MGFLAWVVIIILILAGVYLGVGAVAALTLTQVGENPQFDDNLGTFGLEYEDVRFKSRVDHLQIAGWYVPNAGAKRAVILVHGRNADKQNAISGKFPQLAAELQAAGLAVLMIDLRAHGESEGKRYTFGVHERRDVLGAVDFLLARGFHTGQIGLLGISLGGAAVIGAAVEEPTMGAVVVESSFADINALIQPNWKAESRLPIFFLPGVFLMWRLLVGFDLRDVKPVDELAKIAHRPILILHSKQDEVVDVVHAYALKEAVPSADLVIFEDGSHAELFRDNPKAYLDALHSFITEGWIA